MPESTSGPIRLVVEGSNLALHGLPVDSKKLVRIGLHSARECAEMVLHRSDLTKALSMAQALDASGVPAAAELGQLSREALWMACIVLYGRCHKRSRGRRNFDTRTMLAGATPELLEAHDYFLALRDKHVAHDENALLLCEPVAAINDGTKAYKVEDTQYLAVNFYRLPLQRLPELRALIEHQLAALQQTFTDKSRVVVAELESLPYEELAQLPPLVIGAPGHEDVKRGR